MCAEQNRSIVKEYFFRKNQPSWREYSHYQFRKPTTLVEALDNVITCLERHRLMFVHFAAPRTEHGLGVEVRNLREIEWFEHDDDEYFHDHFFFDHRKEIEVNLNRVIAQSRPFFCQSEHRFHWIIDDWFTIELEQSCNAIIQSCSYVKEFGNDYGSNQFIANVLSAIYPSGLNKWYSSIQVEWDYPGALDNVIHQGRLLMAEYPNPETTQIRESCEVHTKKFDPRSSFSKQAPFKIYDCDLRDYRIYDPKLGQFKCGPIESREDGEFSSFVKTQYLHLHPNREWSLLSEEWHNGYDYPEIIRAERISAEDAVRMLVLNDLAVPIPEYNELANQFMYNPKAPSPIQETDDCDYWDNLSATESDHPKDTKPSVASREKPASEELHKLYQDPDNYWRNVFLYEQRKSGVKNADILSELKRVSSERAFIPIESEGALRDAIRSIAAFHNWPELKGAPGRKSNKV